MDRDRFKLSIAMRTLERQFDMLKYDIGAKEERLTIISETLAELNEVLTQYGVMPLGGRIDYANTHRSVLGTTNSNNNGENGDR